MGTCDNSAGDAAGRPMTLDEAIAHAEDVAGACDTACRREHKQLADWLKELRDMKRKCAISEDSAPVGDMAAMREALTKVSEWMAHRIATGGFEASPTFPTVLENIVLPALAKPPRNCDRTFIDRPAMYYEFKDWCNAKGHTMEPKLAYDAFDWLLATANEKGENDGSK